MSCFSLINSTIVSAGELMQNKAVIIQGSKIVDIIDEKSLPSGIKRIDLKGFYLSPGFIDLQINGAGGAFFGGNPTEDGLKTMEQTLLAQGTTGFLVTAATNSFSIYRKMIDYAIDYHPRAIGNYLGLHLEGPYINPLCKGAHPVHLIKKATLDEVKSLLDRAEGEIRMMTLAPELQPEEVIRYLDAVGIVLSIGHSAASYDEAMHFFTGRKRMATHLYNGMQPMHHRHPGLIPAIFRARPYTSIVVDGIHVAYPMVRLAKQVLGDSLILVTDGATPCSVGAYHHTFKGDRYVTIDTNGKETLSGSALTLLKAISNCVLHVGIALPEAINMATLYPAQVLHIDDHVGQIRSGYDADFVIFDSDFHIHKVYFKGKEKSDSSILN